MTYSAEEHAEKLIATIARLMSKRGNIQAVDILRQASANLAWLDNFEAILYLEVSIELYDQITDYKETIENAIREVANELLKGKSEYLNQTFILPKLEAPENWRENIYSLSSSQFGIPKPAAKYNSDIFMLMPFKNNMLDVVYRDYICKVAEELDLSIKRGDDFFTEHSIVDDIWSAINAAKIIIADCTGRNANVFYELGMSHTLGKKTIMITQSSDDIPFDLQQWRYIQYIPDSQGLKLFRIELRKVILNFLDSEDSPNSNKGMSEMDDIPF